MKILDYNRVIKDLNGYTPLEFIEILKENFKILKHDKDHIRSGYSAGRNLFVVGLVVVFPKDQKDCIQKD